MRVRNTGELGTLIRDARKAHGWSQTTLAEKIGVSRNWVVSIEGGRSGAEIGLVMKALQVLKLSLVVRAHAAGERPDDATVPPTVESPDPTDAQVVHPGVRGPLLTRRGRPLGASRRRHE